MRSYQNFRLLPLIFFAIFFSLTITFLQAAAPQENASAGALLLPGVVAPICHLEGIDGNEYTFPATKTWNMVFFWSLFCHSCLEEMPEVQKHIARVPINSLKTFFVSLDSERMRKALINFSNKRDLKQPILMEQLASDSYVSADRWGVKMTPSVFIVAPDGKVAYSHQGPMDIEKFFGDFAAMIASSTVASFTER